METEEMENTILAEHSNTAQASLTHNSSEKQRSSGQRGNNRTCGPYDRRVYLVIFVWIVF